MSLVLGERPSLVATLHESKSRYDPDVTPSFGQTLVVGVQPDPPVLEVVRDKLNLEIQSEQERWAIQHYPVATSSTEVIVDATGCIGTCVETWMGFPERRRIEMHRDVVRHLLAAFDVM